MTVFNIFRLLPPYLLFLAIFLVIIPTGLAIFYRFCLYEYLCRIGRNTRSLLDGTGSDRKPGIVNRIEQRFQQSGGNREGVNTTAIVDGVYARERLKFLGLGFTCDTVDTFTRILPNLLLSFGLLGTFLGITINLANLSQTITEVDVTDMTSLIEQLDKPLQGMGIAFITSLIAIACSALLTVINLVWNTGLAKSALLSYLEDYADNVYLPQIKTFGPLEEAIDRFSGEFRVMISDLGNNIERAVTNSFSKIEDSATTFKEAASSLEDSRFPEKLSSATTDLSIAQSQFSESSLILKKSTQSFEHSLNDMEKVMKKILAMSHSVEDVNRKYDELVELSKDSNENEKSQLNKLQQQLNNLVSNVKDRMDK